MVIEALELADDDVNYADYDWNGNGEVDQVYVVYCGKGEANGGAKSTIWPHEWELSSAAYYGDGSGAQTLDGVRIDTYACGAELNGMGTIDGIGTMCHEFSHCLGYPDFYDTDYSGGPGMYCWDLMDMGSYNGDGFLPAGYTGYERWVAGWRQPVELKKTTSVSNLKALPDGGESYIIYNDAHPDEFFMLENRQQVGWDSGLPCGGMLIVHCDYDATVWANNQPNDDPRHQRMSWVPADGKIETYSYGGNIYVSESGLLSDLYPSKGVNSFGLNAQTTQAFFNKTSDGT
jgi:M6 family metalloprotease-like protein